VKRVLAAAAAFMIMPALVLSATAASADVTPGPASTGRESTEVSSGGIEAQDETDPTPAAATIVAPAPGADVAGSFQVDVSRGTAANLTLWLDGQYFTNNPGTAATVAFNLYLDGPPAGQSHVIEVGDCTGTCPTSADGTVTSSITVIAYPSVGIDVTSASSSGYFSPEGDGTQDTLTVEYTTLVAGNVKVAIVRNTDGATVQHYDLGAKPIGSTSFVWTGQGTSGAALPTGSYEIMMSVTSSGGSTSNDWIDVVLDTGDPVLGSLARSTATVFPRADGYYDTVAFAADVSEQVSLVQLRITTSAGAAVRTFSATALPAGKVRFTWDGRTASGAMAAAGTAFRWYARDPSGNARLTSASSIAVDRRILSARVTTRTVTPSASYVTKYVGACSRFVSSPNGWTGGAGYYSMWRKANGKSCPNVANKGLVWGAYKLVVPTAPKYGAVKVGALGKSHARSSTAVLTLLRNSTTARNASVRVLQPTYKTYWTAARTFSDLGYGRTVRWRVATSGGDYYDVRSFKVTWTYYVLVA
jgi:flagellar hook assembly protein FlgD